MKKKELIDKLKKDRPDVSVSVHYSVDEDCCQHWDGEQTFDELVGEGLTPYNVEVRVSKIIDGDLISGSDFLGSCWMKYENECEEVDGYFPQMLEEALKELDELAEIHTR